MDSLAKQAEFWIRHPKLFRAEKARMAAEKSLRGFVEFAWPEIEPKRPLVPGRALDAVCEHVEAVARGQILRLLINVPPGFSKSLVTNVFAPAWEWGPLRRPDKRFLSWSYSPKLTLRDNRRCRRVIDSERYRANWGRHVVIDKSQDAKERYDTMATGWRIASSVGGVSTGERGDRLTIDDPHSVTEAESDAVRGTALTWFSESLATRLNDEESSVVVVMQRVHHDDVSNLILEHLQGWEWLCLPMEFESDRRCYTTVPTKWGEPIRCKRTHLESDPLPAWVKVDDADPNGVTRWPQDWRSEDGELAWPERFSAHFLRTDTKPQLAAVGGDYAEACQLQQRPTPREGGQFKSADFRYIKAEDVPVSRLRATIRGWDLAATGRKKARPGTARTASVKMAADNDGRIYVLDGNADHLDELEVELRLEECACGDGPRVEQNIPQDPGQAGKAQVSALARRLAGHNIAFSPESGDKEVRLTPYAAQVKAHNVYLVEGSWNSGYVAELCRLPSGLKDYGDASSRAYGRLLELTKRVRAIPAGPRLVEV